MKQPALRTALAAALFSVAASGAAKPLVVCTEASPEGFDVAQTTVGTTIDAAGYTVFDRLVDFSPGTTNIEPSLAERWEISDDGKQYTFHLRPGVKFQTTDYFKPSRTLNADDVLWSLQRQLDPRHPWHDKAPMGYGYFESMGLKDLIERIEKVDDMTVVFHLRHAEAPFLRDLAMPFTSIYSAEYGDQLLKAGTPEKLNSQPIGTGPFILTRYTKDAQVRYKANPDYFKGKPPADPLVFAITVDANTRLQKLHANECQVALYPKPDDIKGLKADPALRVDELQALVVSYVAMNTQHAWLKDVRVRQAIQMAVDKPNLVNTLFGDGNAVPGTGPYPATVLGFNAAVKDLPYDPAKARALLKQAGVPEGTTLTVFTRNGGGVSNPNPGLSAQLLQADLAKVGLKLDIRVMEWGEMVKAAKLGQHDLLFYGWAGDNGDPDNFVTPNLSCDAAQSGENTARWCDKGFDALITQARAETEPAKRAALYEQAQVIFNEQQPWISLAYPKLFVALRKNVEGYHISPLTNNNFATTQVK
ncbi:ABC transporter substrate-binding protein [Pseudomonas typographi]|uniref:ABC transporter substrate-binding protein n=1 Tax=Pseudomonas typographi TaxID=2715964 RepID=UPI00168535A6|nr:ABC transporter substrate-binding protein [Pseudomonas typographi]MBD1553363.1 ABC transporter substrate-binding protein [Pseudomonas typographi]MBD1585727.1 ABC transporter substrate-binding protein [Pseudomonas typographi]